MLLKLVRKGWSKGKKLENRRNTFDMTNQKSFGTVTLNKPCNWELAEHITLHIESFELQWIC